jgi:hypothetical protein
VVFATVADCALIGTAVLSGTLAAIHLYKSLCPKPREDLHEPFTDSPGADREPCPRRGAGHLTAAAGRESPGPSR